MSSRREKGTGNIYQRENGTWVGRVTIGRKSDGTRKIKYFSGKTESEVKKKIREYNKAVNHCEAEKITVEEYAWNWLKRYKASAIRGSSYDRLENTIKHQVCPQIGSIQIQQLSSDDIQNMLNDLRTAGYAYSTIKKAFDCIKTLTYRATVEGILSKDPMLLIEMPKKSSFVQKEIRYFTKEEVALITEEAKRCYSTGRPVYIYGDAYILTVNTGLRVGELIGLRVEDWNENENTIHVRRNIQSVKKRDDDMNSNGRELTLNQTKTYSGDRIVPLNKSATSAIRSMRKRFPTSEYIVCNSKGKIIPPDHLDRTLYRMLDNIGIDRTGMHSLRHTFASLLFANGASIKMVSELMGHSSTAITANIYVHIIQKYKAQTVNKVDEFLS